MTSIFQDRFNRTAGRDTIHYSQEYADLKLIFLDVRTFRKRGKTILGVQQERWFEEQLNHDKKYTLVCSGSTLNSSRGFSRDGKDWSELTDSFDWMRERLATKRRSLLLAGDIHRNRFVDHLNGAFYEVISSGAARRFKRGNFAILDIGENVTVTFHKKGREKRTIVIDGESWAVTSDSRGK